MRKVGMYSIYDTKGEMHSQFPFSSPNNQTAIRSFTDLVNKGESQIKDHPEDFILFWIGEWDIISGEIKTDDKGIKALAKGIDVIIKED